jgi:hypothetical protein
LDVRPKAVGLIRTGISRLDTPRHSIAVERHARRMGFRYIYTVRPPQDHSDPVAYAVVLAATLDAEAIVVYDLEHVNNQPALVCDQGFDLETVCPQWTWQRCGSTIADCRKGAAR